MSETPEEVAEMRTHDGYDVRPLADEELSEVEAQMRIDRASDREWHLLATAAWFRSHANAAEERARKAEEERDEARAERERLEQIIAAVQTDLVRSYPNWITGKHDLPWLDAIAAEQARIRADDEEQA